MIIDPMAESQDEYSEMQLQLLALATGAIAAGQRWVAFFALEFVQDIEDHRAESLGYEEELEELRDHIAGADPE